MKRKQTPKFEEPSLFDLHDDSNDTPLKGHQVVIIGKTDKYSNSELCDIFSNLGAKVTDVPSKYASLIFVLGNLTEKQNEKIEKLKFNGYELNILDEGDINAILEGEYDNYINLKLPKKLLILKPYHLAKLMTNLTWHAENMPISNPLCNHTLLFAPSIYHHVSPISQVLGNLGILLSDREIDEETDMIVLPDESIQFLSEGIRDENIKFIEDAYNKSSQITFNFQFIRLSDIISYIEARINTVSDSSLKNCFLRYKKTMSNCK